MPEPPAKRPRGRPWASDDPKVAEAHACIVRTIWILGGWGFDLRKQVFPVVARLAADILGLQNANGLPLGPDRIEQIYKAAPPPVSGWAKNGQRLPMQRPWSSMSKEYLEARRPTGGLNKLAERLLRHGGHWDGDRPRYLGDPILTAKFDKLLRENPGPTPLDHDSENKSG